MGMRAWARVGGVCKRGRVGAHAGALVGRILQLGGFRFDDLVASLELATGIGCSHVLGH
jgi:hypothetical protein